MIKTLALQDPCLGCSHLVEIILKVNSVLPNYDSLIPPTDLLNRMRALEQCGCCIHMPPEVEEITYVYEQPQKYTNLPILPPKKQPANRPHVEILRRITDLYIPFTKEQLYDLAEQGKLKTHESLQEIFHQAVSKAV